jgi:hypothetical protein
MMHDAPVPWFLIIRSSCCVTVIQPINGAFKIDQPLSLLLNHSDN